jgi:hypothetical protein
MSPDSTAFVALLVDDFGANVNFFEYVSGSNLIWSLENGSQISKRLRRCVAR